MVMNSQGASKKIVLDSVERMQAKLDELKKLINEYTDKTKSYIPTTEFLEVLASAESFINQLISMAELTLELEHRKQRIKSRQNPNDIGQGYG